MLCRHAGIRYLEQAVFNLDWDQLHLVYEALHERTNIIRLAPHLTSASFAAFPLYPILLRFCPRLFLSSISHAP
jgi:glycerol-3-phosphate dehydrogenase